MVGFIQEYHEELVALCRRYAVRRLEVFGSAATGAFDPKRSDLDFLVEFEQTPGRSRFADFFALKEQLETLFGRDVDLVEPEGIRNPYFLRRVNESRELVYAA